MKSYRAAAVCSLFARATLQQPRYCVIKRFLPRQYEFHSKINIAHKRRVLSYSNQVSVPKQWGEKSDAVSRLTKIRTNANKIQLKLIVYRSDLFFLSGKKCDQISMYFYRVLVVVLPILFWSACPSQDHCAYVTAEDLCATYDACHSSLHKRQQFRLKAILFKYLPPRCSFPQGVPCLSSGSDLWTGDNTFCTHVP